MDFRKVGAENSKNRRVNETERQQTILLHPPHPDSTSTLALRPLLSLGYYSREMFSVIQSFTAYFLPSWPDGVAQQQQPR